MPTRKRGYWYYSRSFEGKQYGASCRVPVTDEDDWTPPKPVEDCAPDQPALPGEQMLLDRNVLAEGQEFFAHGRLDVSPDGNLLAYSTDVAATSATRSGSRTSRTGEMLTDEIAGVLGGDLGPRRASTLYYTTVDDAWRADKVWRHTLGTDQAEDDAGLPRDRRAVLGGRRTHPQRPVHRHRQRLARSRPSTASSTPTTRTPAPCVIPRRARRASSTASSTR